MKKRESNFELLRIVLMLLIIVGHLLLNSEKLGAIGTKEYYITNIMRSFTVFGVNGFILLSGYFGINLNYKKLIRLDIKILFYTWIFFVIGIVSGIHQINIVQIIGREVNIDDIHQKKDQYQQRLPLSKQPPGLLTQRVFLLSLTLSHQFLSFPLLF